MQTFHHCLESYIQAHPDVYGTLNVDFSTEGQINPPTMELKDYSTLNQLQLRTSQVSHCMSKNQLNLTNGKFFCSYVHMSR